MGNKEFWQKQAKDFKSEVQAVNFDPVAEELEIYNIKKLIKKGETVCDLGCGNGRTLLQLAKDFPENKFFGVDFIGEMIDSANQERERMKMRNVEFHTFDASSEKVLTLFNLKFDKVITKRLLINLKGELKYKAVRNIHEMLKNEGIYVMVECFEGPLRSINTIREPLGLEVIKVKEFNEYLGDDFLREISDKFVVERKIDFNSLYYFISRIFNAKLSNDKVDYRSDMNMLAMEIAKTDEVNISGCSPEVIYILRKAVNG